MSEFYEFRRILLTGCFSVVWEIPVWVSKGRTEAKHTGLDDYYWVAVRSDKNLCFRISSFV